MIVEWINERQHMKVNEVESLSAELLPWPSKESIFGFVENKQMHEQIGVFQG